jgi:predicted RNase H-like nuclease (RuvC/YqgF family)
LGSVLVVALVAILLATPARGEEKPRTEVDLLRAEVAELKATVEKLAEQLEKANQRVSWLEKVVAPVHGGQFQANREKKESQRQEVPEMLNMTERAMMIDALQHELRWPHLPIMSDSVKWELRLDETPPRYEPQK